MEEFMPINKKESLIFTFFMCSFMVYAMTVYNIYRIDGYHEGFFTEVWLGFPLAFAVAFIADWFIVSPIAKGFAFRFIKDEDPIPKKVLFISGSMVCGMVLVMSLFGAIHGVGLTSQTFLIWLVNIPFNLIVALPLQIIFAGPIVRLIFRYLFPIGTITHMVGTDS